MRISDWSSDVCSSDLLLTDDQRRQLLLDDGHQLARMGAVVAVVDLADQPGLRVDPGDDGAPAGDAIAAASDHLAQRELRSEERRVGKEGVSQCRSRWVP